MSRRERFAVDGAARVEVRLATGSVFLTRGEGGSVTVELDGPDAERFRIEQRGSTIIVEPGRDAVSRWGGHDVALRVPEGTGLQARLASASLTAEVALGGVDVDAAAGDVRVADVSGPVRVKTASGDLHAARVAGPLQYTTASGSAAVEAVDGPARLHSASGEVRVGTAGGALAARSASGEIRVDVFAGSDLSCKTMSGDVEIGVPPGRQLHVDLQTLSGAIRNDFEVGADAPASRRSDAPASRRSSLQVRTMSGDVTLLRAGRA